MDRVHAGGTGREPGGVSPRLPSALGLRQQEQRTPPPTVRGLYIEPQTLDLGEVWETPQHTFRLTIQNFGKAAQLISGFQTTCGCLQLDPSEQTIASGDKAEFTCKLNLMRRLPHQLGLARRPVSVHLDPVFKGDSAATRGWEVKGVALSRASISTAELAFEDRCAHEGPRVWQKARATAHVPLKSLQASVVPKSAAIRIEKSAANPEEFLIFVSPNPSLPVGQFQFEVQLQALSVEDEVYPCSSIHVGGNMQPPSRVTPRLVLLGEQTVSSEAEADVTLQLPASDWKIDHIETDTTDTLVRQGKPDREGRVPLHIRQQIRQIGDGVATIRIAVRKPNKQIENVPMEVRYYGQNGPR